MAKLSKKTIELLKTPATRQDSIDVLNSQLEQNAYYDKLAKYLQKKPVRRKYSKNDEGLYKTDFDIDLELSNSRNILKNADFRSKDEYDVLKTSPQELRKKAAQYIKYAKSEGKNKYHYLDLMTGSINFDAPFALYNSKIQPKGLISRFFDNSVPGDTVDTWEYDPLAVTPVDMLTPKQKKLREKLYGPQSYSDLEKTDLEEIPYKQLKGLESNYNYNPEMYVTNSNKTKAEYTPEHYIDIVDINGKNPQRIPFESLEEKASYLKQNPLHKLGQWTYVDSKRRGDTKPKLKAETLEYLKNKK